MTAPTPRKRPAKKAAPKAVEPKPSARQAEADNPDAVTIKLRGVTITIPRNQGKWPLAATRRFNRGNEIGGVLALIGDETLDALEAAGATNDDLNEIGKRLNEELGTGN